MSGTTEKSPDTSPLPAQRGADAKATAADAAQSGDNGTAAQPDGDNVVPLPAKKAGLTLESLKAATVSGDAVPLTIAAATAVVIEVKKPTKGVPFRAHPDPAYTVCGYSLEVKTPGVIGEVTYLVDPPIAEMIPASVRYQRLCLCYDGWQRQPFIWPINIPVEGTRVSPWTVSANRVWHAAKKDWACLVSAGGQYLLGKPILPMTGEPVWPNMSFAEIMLIAFRDQYIDDPDHPEVAKRRIVIVSE